MSSSHAHQAPSVPKEPMPVGVHNVYIFEVFNTTSWSVILGAPMLLFLQHLNATATILAIAASLNPILNILQIPAARFVEQVGYRRFVLAGWSSRSFFIVGMTIVAFLPDSIDRTTRIVMILFLSFGFNALRGISACGLLPWFTHIVPESRRGEFLAKDQMAGAIAVVACLFVSGSLLKLHHTTLASTIAAGLIALRFVDEPKTMTWNVFMSELLVQTPSRAVSRVIGRLRGPGI